MANPFGVIAKLLRPLMPATRSLDAAGGGRRWADDRRINSGAQLHVNASTVGARAAHFTINNPHGVRIVESLIANIAGTGIRPRSMHPSEGVRAALQRAFTAWCDVADAERRMDWYGLQQAAVRDLATHGEALFHLTADRVTAAPVLRRLHPEQLARDVSRRLADGGAIYQGVEFDADGMIRAYHVRPSAPGDVLAGLPSTPVRRPAGEIIHVFRQLLPGQVRGLSWFAAVLLAAKDLDALADAMLVRAKVAALVAGFITDPDGNPPLDGTQSGSTFDASLEPGALITLGPGKGVEFSEVPDQGGAAGLMTSTLRAISAGAGVTYEQATGDYSQVNYSSARAALLEFRRFVESIQHHQMVFQFCRPVWQAFIRWQVIAGQVPATAYMTDRAAFEAAKWIPPRWAWVDPQKDAQAAEIEVRNRFRSRSDVIAERGEDAEDVDREIAADQARLERFGIRESMPSTMSAPANDQPADPTQARHLAHTLMRAAPRPTSINEDRRTADLVASTGAGVVRYDIEGPFTEVLDVAPASVDLTRADAMPLLDSHRQDGLDRVLGVVRGIRFESGSLIVTVEFSPRAEAVWNDVKAGIIRNVSVGYAPVRWVDRLDAKGARVRTVTRWELHEVSLVAVGADPSAQVRTLS